MVPKTRSELESVVITIASARWHPLVQQALDRLVELPIHIFGGGKFRAMSRETVESLMLDTIRGVAKRGMP